MFLFFSLSLSFLCSFSIFCLFSHPFRKSFTLTQLCHSLSLSYPSSFFYYFSPFLPFPLLIYSLIVSVSSLFPLLLPPPFFSHRLLPFSLPSLLYPLFLPAFSHTYSFSVSSCILYSVFLRPFLSFSLLFSFPNHPHLPPTPFFLPLIIPPSLPLSQSLSSSSNLSPYHLFLPLS